MKRRKFITRSMTAAAGSLVIPTIVPSSVFGSISAGSVAEDRVEVIFWER